jgi:hypothetical protein
MTAAEVKKEIQVLREHRKEVTATKEAAKAFLVQAGILDKKGKRLTKPYR